MDELAPGPELDALVHEAWVRGFLVGAFVVAGVILFVGGLLTNWAG